MRSHALTLLAPAHTPQNSPNNIQKPEPNNESGEEKIAKSGNENHGWHNDEKHNEKKIMETLYTNSCKIPNYRNTNRFE